MSRWYLKMQHDLNGEEAVVTDAASGIGEAFATAFIEAGTSLCDLSAKTRPSRFEAPGRHWRMLSATNTTDGAFGSGACPANPLPTFKQITAVADPPTLQLAIRLGFQ